MTPQEVKAKFRERGETVASWADHHGFKRDYVYRILNGQNKGRFGEMHRIAVALGLKPDPAKAQV